MKDHQYSDNLKDDDFFFRIPVRLGCGTKKDLVHIMLTSRALMNNIDHLKSGVLQIDGTYRLIKNNYPWIVIAVVDTRGKFHPIGSMFIY